MGVLPPGCCAVPGCGDRQLVGVGEKWLDIRVASWPQYKALIEARLDLAKRSGCDGVEPDQNNPSGDRAGFAITLADQKAWYLEVARMAHDRGLSVGQKNGIETTDADTIAAFDWNLNEECNMYSECDVLSGFIKAGKAVFQVEYTDEGMTYDKTCRPTTRATSTDFSRPSTSTPGANPAVEWRARTRPSDLASTACRCWVPLPALRRGSRDPGSEPADSGVTHEGPRRARVIAIEGPNSTSQIRGSILPNPLRSHGMAGKWNNEPSMRGRGK